MLYNETEKVVLKTQKIIEELTPACNELIKSYFKNKNNPQAWEASLSNICKQDIIKTSSQSTMLLQHLRISLKKNTTLGDEEIQDISCNLAGDVQDTVLAQEKKPQMGSGPKMR